MAYFSALMSSTQGRFSMFGWMKGSRILAGSSITNGTPAPSDIWCSRRAFSVLCSRLTILYFLNKASFCQKVNSGPIENFFCLIALFFFLYSVKEFSVYSSNHIYCGLLKDEIFEISNAYPRRGFLKRWFDRPLHFELEADKSTYGVLHLQRATLVRKINVRYKIREEQ